MSLDFETKFEYIRSSGSATTVCMVKVNEAEVWVAWSDGAVTAHTSVGLDYVLDPNYYLDNHVLALPEVIVRAAGSGTITSMTEWAGKVYIVGSANLQEYDGSTKQFLRTLFTATGSKSNICAANGRIWICADPDSTSSDQDRLLSYELSTAAFTFRALPGRKQTTRRFIIDGLDGKLFVTSHNDHSIISYDTATGDYIGKYKINRHPYKLAVNQNKQLYVIADTATISLFDQATLTASTYCDGLGSATIVDDLRTGYIWLGGGTGSVLYRVVKSTTGAIPTETTVTQGSDLTTDALVLSNQYTYDKYDPVAGTTVSTTIRPHLFIRSGSKVTVCRATALKGVNSSQILGTAMIATGAQGYYGG